MRFAFTEQQQELRAAVAAMLENECTVADLRALADAGEVAGAHGAREAGGTPGTVGRSGERWAVLQELGAPGLLVPEDRGGVGLSEIELVGVLEEAGRVALPEPLAETACLAAPVLGSAARATVGGVDVTPAGPAGSAERTGGHRRRGGGADPLEVRVPRVPATAGASTLLLCVPHAGGGWEVHAVAAGDAEITPTPALDRTRRLAEVAFSPSGATEVAAGAAAARTVADLADRGAFAAAAQLLGLSDRMITMAAAYACERHQFGVPVGSFQAVKHHLADARVRLEFARPAVYRAAWSLATGDGDRAAHCSMAKALASDAADLAARVALQVHGAIGYTWECDLHLFMKRAWALSAEWGSARTHRALVLQAARRALPAAG